MNIVCKCGKGYASLYDRLCRFCRENHYCPTRSACTRYGIRRGEGLTLDQLEKVKQTGLIRDPDVN